MKWSVLKNTDELNLTPFLVGDTITYAWWVDNSKVVTYFKIKSIKGFDIIGALYNTAHDGGNFLYNARLSYMPGFWMYYIEPDWET